jgi:Zn-dependent protease
MIFSKVQMLILWIIPMIFAITVHEVAHGYVANRLGDPTAKMLGRLTLNPIKHIDLLGTIIIPGVLILMGAPVFGYAKPVPVDWRNLRNFRRDMALVALAGPATNLLMAIGWAIIAKIGMSIAGYVGMVLLTMGMGGIVINLVLLVLNLIPIPPLDGSRVVQSFLTGTSAVNYARLEPYGFFILLGLLILGVLNYLLMPPVNFLMGMITGLFGLTG